ncbi:hypothetical protein SDC9_188462 [bioreactor metagenome]|uniref:Uncharacterized protein n=1 Tax=bioreactor metagenome TaxID=1076179 RepID=A0A645HR46_9ZZZZ
MLPDSAGVFIAAGIGPLGAPVTITLADSVRYNGSSEGCRGIKSSKISGSLQSVAERLNQAGAKISPGFNLLLFLHVEENRIVKLLPGKCRQEHFSFLYGFREAVCIAVPVSADVKFGSFCLPVVFFKVLVF